MRIDELLNAGFTRSFEYFPPKNDDEAEVLARTLEDLEPLHPSFVSVTYRGGRESRQRTYDLVAAIERRGHVSAMAHLICVGHRREEMRDILHAYREAGVSNVMALGGDIPDDPALVASDFAHAIDLVELAREVGGFSIGVAAHPLGHPRSTNLETDRHFLAEKLSLADFAVTQFFFRADEWSRLVEQLADLGVERPVLPGIMPVTSLSSLARMSQMGAPVPESLAASLEAASDRGGPSAVRDAGIDAAVTLCEELMELGAPGLHFYTLNRSSATREIHQRLFAKGS